VSSNSGWTLRDFRQCASKVQARAQYVGAVCRDIRCLEVIYVVGTLQHGPQHEMCLGRPWRQQFCRNSVSTFCGGVVDFCFAVGATSRCISCGPKPRGAPLLPYGARGLPITDPGQHCWAGQGRTRWAARPCQPYFSERGDIRPLTLYWPLGQVRINVDLTLSNRQPL